MIKKELQQELNRTKVVLDYARQEIKEKDKEIKRLKEEYVILQNASDEVEEEKDKEIERLNNTLFKREKKWEKWTTEKGILSTKMSEYLCKYHNLKKEYSKLVEINTNRKKEIERLNNIIEKAIKGIEDYYYGDEEYKEYDYTLAYQIYHILKGSDKE